MSRVIAIGVDVVDVEDVKESLVHFGDRYLRRLFTDGEIAYCLSACDRSTVASRLGARFAAKEATLKALRASERGISPRSVEVLRRNDGAIDVALFGAAFAAAREAGATSLSLSMSHEGHFAAAVVIAQATTAFVRRSRIRWAR